MGSCLILISKTIRYFNFENNSLSINQTLSNQYIIVKVNGAEVSGDYKVLVNR